jgi:hypothetical protein
MGQDAASVQTEKGRLTMLTVNNLVHAAGESEDEQLRAAETFSSPNARLVAEMLRQFRLNMIDGRAVTENDVIASMVQAAFTILIRKGGQR